MPINLVLNDLAGCCLFAYETFDAHSCAPESNVERAFPLFHGGGFYADGIAVDYATQRVGLAVGNTFSWIAGQKEMCGFRDGPGEVAIFGMGTGLYGGTIGVAGDGTNIYVTDGRNNKIRKLTPDGDGTWTVSTLPNANFRASQIGFIGGFLWALEEFGPLRKLDATGTTVGAWNFPFPAEPWEGPYADASGLVLYFTMREPFFSTVWKFTIASATFTQIAGLTNAQANAAYPAQNWPVDGPLMDSTIHTGNITYIHPDASFMFVGGGDEVHARKLDFVTGRVSSLCTNGEYLEIQTRDNAPGFYIGTPIGYNPATGWPHSLVYPWILRGARTILRLLVGAPVSGGTTNSSQYVTQSVPLTMVAGQQYSVSLTFLNNGDTVWNEPALYRLGSENPRDNVTWGTHRAFIAGNVQPGDSYNFVFTVTAPLTPGVYNFRWGTVRDGVAWFGAVSDNLQITVTPGIPPPPTGDPITSISVKL